MKIAPCLAALLLCGQLLAQNTAPLQLNTAHLQLRMELEGGAISSVQRPGLPTNPLSWALQPQQMPPAMRQGPPFRGHFLCVGRWGAPSDAEIAQGIPHNGENNTRTWTVLRPPATVGGLLQATAVCGLPLDQYHVTRTLSLDPSAPLALVQERVKNTGATGRLFNLVQHPTIGPPFLDEKTLIDCNAGPGFDQRTAADSLNQNQFRWPHATLRDGPADLRRTTDPRGYVTTHLFDPGVQQGWIAASSPSTGLLLGYVWQVQHYPWLNVWHHAEGGHPVAHGLEFGTTGKGAPYAQLATGLVQFLGQPMFSYIEPMEEVNKSYVCFLLPIPASYRGVASLSLQGGQLTVVERETGEKMVVETKLRWP